MDPTTHDTRPAPRALPALPALLPGLRRLWRDGETLQLGRTPGRSVVLAGIDEPVRRALALLDGTRDAARLEADASRAGCAPQRTAELVGLLDSAGLLEDAARVAPSLLALPREERDRLGPDLAALSLLTRGRPAEALERRTAARVQVVGAGRVGTLVASTLAAAGVGTVDVVDAGTTRAADVGAGGPQPQDVGRSRGEAARRHVQEVAPSARSGPVELPDLVVLTPAKVLDEQLAADLLRRGVPHLVAEVRGQVGVVGPLVLPGRSSCLRCLDLTRTDRDPGWPWVAAQLGQAPPGPVPCDAALAVSVAGQAALQVLAVLDEVAAPASVDGTLELVLPDYRWRRRSWSPHPACDCTAVGG
ncbi:MAG: UBA/THIF-type binding protein [Frankiales bacterium]|nr:UBA/THIF-type binding protein [Frankiales bacterium]